MLSEREIELLVDIPEISVVVEEIRQDFLMNSPFEEISTHDFLSTMFMAPPVAMALANGTVGLLEELSLNKKARTLSKGGFFLKQDPVVRSVNHLTERFDIWEERIYTALKRIIDQILLKTTNHVPHQGIFITMLNTSYLFIKLIETFFLPEGEEIIGINRTIAESEYRKLVVIGDKLELNEIPLFSKFLEAFEVK